MKKAKMYYRISPMVLVLTLLLYSCGILEGETPESKSIELEDEVEMTLTLQTGIVAASGNVTDMENYVGEIDVLAFRIENNQEFYEYRAEGKSIIDGQAVNEKEFVVSLYKSATDLYRFVILANARTAVQNAGSFSKSATKEQVLSRIVADKSTAWQTGLIFDPIPMWGETDPMYVTDDTQIENIPMLRSISRIDFTSTVSESTFKIKSVHLYNRFTKGRVAPAGNNLSWNPTYSIYNVFNPTIPALNREDMVVRNGQAYENTGTDNSVVASIYTFEADAADPGDDLQATCLVLGGYYNGSNVPTYYRVDFADPDTGSNNGGNNSPDAKFVYYPVMRNNLYEMRLTGVSGLGFEDPDEAFSKRNAGVTVEILTWSISNQSVKVRPDPWSMDVSESSITHNGKASTGVVFITCSSTWTVSSQSPEWLTAEASGSDRIVYKVTEMTTPGTRLSYLVIKAQNFTKYIKVTQSM